MRLQTAAARRAAVTALGFAILALALPATAGAETEHVSRTVALEPGGMLKLKNFSGRVTITAGDSPEVRIEALRRGSPESLAAYTLDIHKEGSTVVVEANHHPEPWPSRTHREDPVETEFDVTVPRRTDLDVSVFKSPVSVAGVEGRQNVRSFSSRVSLDGVVGRIDAHTFSGPVEIRPRQWQSDQSIAVETFSGDIVLHVPATARAAVDFRSFSGELNSSVPLTFRESTRRRVRGRLGLEAQGDGRVELKTFSGDVDISR